MNKRIKVAINCSYYGKKFGGIKEYIYNLVINLIELDLDLLCYIAPDNKIFWNETMPKSIRTKVTPYNSSQKIKRSLFQERYWKNEETSESFDVFHSPFYYFPFSLKCKTLITIHDLRFERFPSTYSLLRLLFIKFKVKKAISKVNHIITISDFTKSELTDLYQVNESKVTTILEAIDNRRFQPKQRTLSYKNLDKNKYILTVGHIEPRKNYLKLIQAFSNSKYYNDYKLVIVGREFVRTKKVLDAITKNQNVLYLNFVDEQDLLALYENALFFIFPSIYEGFGFPPLEAASMGITSAVSNVSSIPEVCGDAALYFNPKSVSDIKDKIDKLISDKTLRKELKEKSRINLQRFSWKKNAIQTLEVYKNLI